MKKILFLIFSIILLYSCNSVESTIINPAGINSINEWKIEFNSIENQIDKSIDESIVTATYSSLAKEFLDDFKFELLGNYGKKIVETANENNGYIRANIVEGPNANTFTSEVKSASFTLYDNSNELLGRIKLSTNSSPYSPTKFAKDCAKELSKIL